MCLIAVGYETHPRFRLVVAANRDESFSRETDRAQFWESAPELLAGRDRKAGGTWLGLTRAGRFGAVTNYRDPAEFGREALSRGELLRECLLSDKAPADFFRSALDRISGYNGYNMLAVDLGAPSAGLTYHTNSDPARPEGRIEHLGPGYYGLSNELLDSPWPKLLRVREGLESIVNRELAPDETLTALLDLMDDRERFPDEQLPDTGIGIEYERLLSSVFIPGDRYGTRSTTVLTVDREGFVRFREKNWEPEGRPGEIRDFEFRIAF